MEKYQADCQLSIAWGRLIKVDKHGTGHLSLLNGDEHFPPARLFILRNWPGMHTPLPPPRLVFLRLMSIYCPYFVH